MRGNKVNGHYCKMRSTVLPSHFSSSLLSFFLAWADKNSDFSLITYTISYPLYLFLLIHLPLINHTLPPRLLINF